MNNIFWKAFKLGELFERSTKLALGANQKDLNLTKNKENSDDVALISASRNGSGRVGYISLNKVDSSFISINKITYDDQWGYTYFQEENFVITGGHNAILEVKDIKFKNILNKNLKCYAFLSLIINHITIKSGIFDYGYKVNNKLDREFILLPCLEVTKDDEYIWEEKGHYYTLAVEYIKELMGKAKKEKENRTIRLYESERKKYESGYEREKKVLTWKSFKLENIFSISTEHYLEKSKKNYNISEIKTDEYCVAVCAASRDNNGIVGYINEIDDVPLKKRKGYLTKGGFGHVFYQDDWFIKPGGSWGMLDILKINNESLKKILDSNKNSYLFIAKILTKIFTNFSKFGYVVPFGREFILLPCLEVTKDDEYIWEEKGHYYTLAVEFISYLYLTGKYNHNDKLVKEYTYKY